MSLIKVWAHEPVKRDLMTCLALGKLPNSLLFSGPDELGMKKMALFLAQALNCLKRQDEACGECSSCRSIFQENFPDVILLASKENKMGIGIDEIREIRQLAFMRPMVGRHRIFIFEEAEKMSLEALNALLKILEEPPSYTYFILITTNADSLPATIRSRCQSFNFKAIDLETITARLISLGYEPIRARTVACLAQGSLEKALSLDWEKILSKRHQAWQAFRLFLKEDSTFLTKLLASSRGAEFKSDLEEMVNFFITFFRDLLLLKEKGPETLLINPDLKEEMQIMVHQLSQEFLLKGIELGQQILGGLDRNLNPRLLWLYFYAQMRSRDHA
ncbi:MAG: DNA polymerase III subunit [Candidatus Aminicenantes bacterium]|nr:DNA polymerase III subunit [Candidatus Aminicenantes bacterium]